MTFLTLTFYDDHFQSDFFRIDWPNDKPLTRARISPQKMKGLVYTDLIMLNRSTSERVFFATGTQLIKEHEKMKRVLKSLGEPFDEHVSVRKEVTVGFFRRRTIPKKVGLLFGSTANPETIGKIFDSYVSWHALSWPFAFVVADREPPGWKSQIGPLVSLSTVAGKASRAWLPRRKNDAKKAAIRSDRSTFCRQNRRHERRSAYRSERCRRQ